MGEHDFYLNFPDQRTLTNNDPEVLKRLKYLLNGPGQPLDLKAIPLTSLHPFLETLIWVLLLTEVFGSDDEIELEKFKRTTQQGKTTSNQNSLSDDSKPNQDGVEYIIDDSNTQQPNQLQQQQIQQQYNPSHFAVPIQYIQPQANVFPQRFAGQQQYYQPQVQPLTMILVPQAALGAQYQQAASTPSQQPGAIQYQQPSVAQYQAYTQNSPQFQQATQQLLAYYQNNPQARLQLLQGYNQQLQQPFQPFTPYQAQSASTHLSPTSLYQSPIASQYFTSPQSVSPTSAPITSPTLNSQEYLPQSERLLSAGTSGGYGPYASLRASPYKARY